MVKNMTVLFFRRNITLQAYKTITVRYVTAKTEKGKAFCSHSLKISSLILILMHYYIGKSAYYKDTADA